MGAEPSSRFEIIRTIKRQARRAAASSITDRATPAPSYALLYQITRTYCSM